MPTTEAKKEERWNIDQAIREAGKMGVSMSRPTVIRLCREQEAGYQITGPHGHWVVYPEIFMALIRGPQEGCGEGE